MPIPTIAEYHVRRDREQAAATLEGHVRDLVPGVVLTGGWYATPWTRDRDAWRRVATAGGGRRPDRLTLDLVDAGPRLTLLTVTVEPGGGLLRRRPTLSVTALASRLRDRIEAGEAGEAAPAGRPATAATGPEAAVPAAAVGYSRA
jgi:hypothetical protein